MIFKILFLTFHWILEYLFGVNFKLKTLLKLNLFLSMKILNINLYCVFKECIETKVNLVKLTGFIFSEKFNIRAHPLVTWA